MCDLYFSLALCFHSTIFITNIKFPIQQMLQHAPRCKYCETIRRSDPSDFFGFGKIIYSLLLSIFSFFRPAIDLTTDNLECTELLSRKMLKSSVSSTQILRKSISNGRSIIQPRALTSPPVMYHVTVSKSFPMSGNC